MAFTYDVTTNRGKVRFLVQDTTDSTARPALLQDAEIDFTLETEANIYMAAAMCCDALSTRFRGLVNKTVGNLSLTYDRAAETWKAISDRLRRRGSLHMLPTAGGILVADRDAIWEDTTLLRPDIFSGIHQDPQELSPSNVPINQEYLP